MLDSFIEYLAARIDGVLPALPVRWCRVSKDDPASYLLQQDVLNVTALDTNRVGATEEMLVSLDIITVDERQAWAWADKVNTELLAERFCRELDYATDPDSAPQPTGRAVFWDRDGLGFSRIHGAAANIHLNATFPIKHVSA